MQICEGKACIGISIVLCQDKGNCSEISVKQSTSPNFWCRNVISKLQYKIWHNGSEGIKKFEAFIWLKYISHEFNGRFLQTTEVKFLWIDSSEKTYRKSGNPGYIIGKPILTSRKISTENGTSGKREVMELSDMDNYLSVLGSEKGICSFQKRVPITFQENSHYSCSLLLSKDNFGKESCIELQKTIFMLLLGEDVVHAKNDNYFNKFIATFGNAKVENTGDWIQILIDFFPVTATQVGFKFGYNTLMCKNIISELFVEIAYSNVGSFFYPQAKILGTSFQFGKHRDLLFYCGTLGCENASHYQYFKLSSMVHFIDLTEPANNAYAEPLGLKVKLPHDFFYPFFSIGSMSQSLNKFILIFLFLTIKKTVW